MMVDYRRVLVVAAHPDDEVLGCGGTMARLAQQGKEISVAILGEGITSRYGDTDPAIETQLADLQSCSRRCMEILGAREIHFFGLPDNKFDTIPLLHIVKIIEEHIAKVAPDIIFTHHQSDLNVDHRITLDAVLTATRPVEKSTVNEIYSFEILSSTEWAFHQYVPVFRPNVFIDIGSTLETKIRALQIYKNELKSFPHPRSVQNVRALAARRGSAAGFQAGEAFELIRAFWRL